MAEQHDKPERDDISELFYNKSDKDGKIGEALSVIEDFNSDDIPEYDDFDE